MAKDGREVGDREIPLLRVCLRQHIKDLLFTHKSHKIPLRKTHIFNPLANLSNELP